MYPSLFNLTLILFFLFPRDHIINNDQKNTDERLRHGHNVVGLRDNSHCLVVDNTPSCLYYNKSYMGSRTAQTKFLSACSIQ